MSLSLWIATRKGAFRLGADVTRRQWRLSGPQLLGHVIHHIVQDPRRPELVLLAAKTGHLGPTMYRSTDGGKTLTSIGNGTHSDHHDMWIDPDDPDNIYIGK